MFPVLPLHRVVTFGGQYPLKGTGKPGENVFDRQIEMRASSAFDGRMKTPLDVHVRLRV